MAKRKTDQPELSGTAAQLAALDPHASYLVRTANPTYDGDIGSGEDRITIRAGIGRIPALPADADEWDIAERRRLFEFMMNAHVGYRRTYKWDEMKGERTEVYTSVPAYAIEEDAPAAPSKKKADAVQV